MIKLYKWLMDYKYEGCVVSTFMKMNIQGKDGNIKLASSTVFVHKRWFKNINKINFYEVKYVFYIKSNVEGKWSYTEAVDQYGNKYYVIYIGLLTLIKFMHDGLKNPNSYEFEVPTESTKFWGTLDLEACRKNRVDKIISNGVFIFLNDAWYNIVLAFKLNNIDLNGGKISSRHIMKPTDFVLGTFINKLIISSETKLNLDTINNFYSNSYKNEMLSNIIDLNLYRKFKDNEELFKRKGWNTEGAVYESDDEELNNSQSIINGYLSYNYKIYCVLLRKEIKKKFDLFLNTAIMKKEGMEIIASDIRSVIKRITKTLPLQSNSEKKPHKRRKGVSIFDGAGEKVIENEGKRLIKLKEDIFSQEKLINYLKLKIDKEYEKNDFNSYNLIELEEYSKKFRDLTEE